MLTRAERCLSRQVRVPICKLLKRLRRGTIISAATFSRVPCNQTVLLRHSRTTRATSLKARCTFDFRFRLPPGDNDVTTLLYTSACLTGASARPTLTQGGDWRLGRLPRNVQDQINCATILVRSVASRMQRLLWLCPYVSIVLPGAADATISCCSCIPSTMQVKPFGNDVFGGRVHETWQLVLLESFCFDRRRSCSGCESSQPSSSSAADVSRCSRAWVISSVNIPGMLMSSFAETCENKRHVSFRVLGELYPVKVCFNDYAIPVTIRNVCSAF